MSTVAAGRNCKLCREALLMIHLETPEPELYLVRPRRMSYCQYYTGAGSLHVCQAVGYTKQATLRLFHPGFRLDERTITPEDIEEFGLTDYYQSRQG